MAGPIDRTSHWTEQISSVPSCVHHIVDDGDAAAAASDVAGADVLVVIATDADATTAMMPLNVPTIYLGTD